MSPEIHSWRGLWWISGGPRTTDQVPCMRVQRVCGPSGQAISDLFFLLGFCVSLRIWAAVGKSSPSLISLLSTAVGTDADDTGVRVELPVSTVRAVCPWIPGPPIGLDTHLHSPKRLAQYWTLDLKAQCEVGELGARPSECHFYHVRGARGCSPRTLPYKLAHGISSWALTTGSAGSPLDLNPGKGLLIRQGHLDVVTHVMQVS